ncbi:MAG: hypothetical protein Q8910_17890, partial [Bacteroidota bacterium]|nr:hypothetical protein [Bacteroidota bacterium]
VPLQKIKTLYKIIENFHNKVILMIKLELKQHLKEIIMSSKYRKIIFATEPYIFLEYFDFDSLLIDLHIFLNFLQRNLSEK